MREKEIPNNIKTFFVISFVIFVASGCNPSSTANFLFSGINYDNISKNTILFGRIVDKKTNEPLIGANVVLTGYKLGAATDFYGNYVIKNIPPGTYNIKASYVGYERSLLPDIKLDSNKIYLIDFELQNQNFPGIP